MNIDNDYIAEQFSLLAKLMDIHGENSFKTRSYSSAAFTIEKLPQPLTDMPPEKFTSIKGIGDAIGKKIQDIIRTGELPLLRQYIDNTPSGILEMLKIKGLGPKKIATIWKEMGIESIGELLYACQENRLLLYKGFGEKTQQNVQDTIEFYMKHQGSHLYADVEAYAQSIQDLLTKAFPSDRLAITGDFSRHIETIDHLQWITTTAPEALRSFFGTHEFTEETGDTERSISGIGHFKLSHFKGPEGVQMAFIHSGPETFVAIQLTTSSSEAFLEAWDQRTHWDKTRPWTSEEEVFKAVSLPYIPPFLREQPAILDDAARGPIPALIQPRDIHAIIHSHSTWSDGSQSLEEMAKACIQQGFEYLVISDHSKSAFYANGLNEERIREQHQQIDELNRKLAPFVIFKSIECDILNDGALDYSDNILSTFDLVIASVHSNLKMNEEKAMMRLLKAIENPYTTILGHMTGRLLLSRPGYPVNHEKIIDACAANQVVIELNAHPRRLDIDWRWIRLALEKGVLISVDPDAHSVEGYKDVKYGTLAARKGGLTPEKNLSSFGLQAFKDYLAARKKAKGI
jgi:DNA polymerase (family 10)